LSEFDLKLSWAEEPSSPAEKSAQGDRLHLQSEEAGEAGSHQVERESQAQSSDGRDGLADPQDLDDAEWSFEEFEYSDAREAAIEAALGKIQGQVRAPVVAYLRELLEDHQQLAPIQLTARLDACEAWLQTQLQQWSPEKSVVPKEETEDLQQRTELFNQAVSCGSDALNLGLEVVALIRGGQPDLASKLLPQIEAFLGQALESLDQVF
jgi:hypothetical protein